MQYEKARAVNTGTMNRGFRMDDNGKKVSLTKKDFAALAVEGGIASIPYIGGLVQTMYYGSKSEKRFKRIEEFYEDLNKTMKELKEKIPDQIPDVNSKDQLIGIFESINDEIEKARAQRKINLYKNLYKNCLLKINETSWDNEEYYLQILNQMTEIEIELLCQLMKNNNGKFFDNISCHSVPQELVAGSLNRLSDFGLLQKSILGIDMKETYNQHRIGYRISPLGKSFIHTTLS